MLEDSTFPEAGFVRGSLLQESSVQKKNFGLNF
jgi:hypothetical protein